MFVRVRPRSSRWRYCGLVGLDFRRLMIQSQFDDRGARLAWKRTRLRTSAGISVGILFNAPNWMLKQIMPQLTMRGARKVSLKGPSQKDWLYAYVLPQGLDEPLERFFSLLADVVTIGRAPEPVVHCLALDLYKVPDPAVDPMQWDNTPAGSLVYRSKYWSGDDSVQAFLELREQMSRIVRDHPSLSGADSIISIPGRDSREIGHGERLARAVAENVGKPFHRTTALYHLRRGAKEGFRLEPHHVDVSGEVLLENVIIVDDVFRSGASMKAVAEEATKAGALEVFGLVAAKTLKN